MKKNKIFFVVCLLMFVGGLAVGGNYFLKQKENENIYEKVREEKKSVAEAGNEGRIKRNG